MQKPEAEYKRQPKYETGMKKPFVGIHGGNHHDPGPRYPNLRQSSSLLTGVENHVANVAPVYERLHDDVATGRPPALHRASS